MAPTTIVLALSAAFKLTASKAPSKILENFIVLSFLKIFASEFKKDKRINGSLNFFLNASQSKHLKRNFALRLVSRRLVSGIATHIAHI